MQGRSGHGPLVALVIQVVQEVWVVQGLVGLEAEQVVEGGGVVLIVEVVGAVQGEVGLVAVQVVEVVRAVQAG